MKHNLALYNRSMDDNDVPGVVVMGILPLLALIVGTVMIVPPMSAGAPIVFFTALALSSLNVLLHNTHVYRGLELEHRELVRAYHRLPEEVKAKVALNVSDIRGLSERQAEDLADELSRLKKLHEKRKAVEAEFSGSIYELRNSIKEAAEAEEREFEILSEMKELH